MATIKELIISPSTPEYYQSFLCSTRGICLDKNRLNLSVLCGDERSSLIMPTNGDSSLLLRYKNKEGAALSLTTDADNLNILQLQGAHSAVSYQVANGLNWVHLFGDQLQQIAQHPQSSFSRISMPPLEKIVGLYESGTDCAVTRYKQLANFLGLRFSHEESSFVRELSK